MQREVCRSCHVISGNTRHITPCAGTLAGPQGLNLHGSTLTGKNTILEVVCIPPAITAIGDFAFRDSSGLSIVTFSPGSRLATIGTGAFERSSSLISIEIPASVTNIGNWAFDGVSSLTSVRFAPGSRLETIGFYAFRGTNITSIVFPDNLVSIGLQAFAFNARLTSIELPASMVNIGNWAFAGCSSLTTVTVHAASPPTLGGWTVFNNTNENLQVRVPSASLTNYREVWGPLLPAPGATRIIGF
jgi:hypothetical protein